MIMKILKNKKKGPAGSTYSINMGWLRVEQNSWLIQTDFGLTFWRDRETTMSGRCDMLDVQVKRIVQEILEYNVGARGF
jgi:hypothetical protein